MDALPPALLSADAAKRLRRLRAMAWFLDRAIPLGGAGRVGLDPILGLIPGLGDWAGAVLSCYVMYEAARLGVGWPVLGRMLGNVLLETLIGSVPVAGDVFDFVWQANMRNLRLVERHFRPEMKPRSLAHIAALLVIVFALLATIVIGAAWLLVAALRRLL